MYRIGIDIGGTFTDLAAVDDAGRVVIAKASSTPHDPSEGLLEGLSVLAAELGVDRRPLLARDRAHRPRDDRGDQRAPGAQGRDGRRC